MNQNPYSSPESSNEIASTLPSTRVRAPAIGILIVTVIWSAMMTIVFLRVIIETTLKFSAPERGELSAENWGELIGSYLWPALFFLFEALIFYGAVCMLRLRGYRFAMVSAILSLIPLCSGCAFLGIPFGIWAIIVLRDPEVRSSFH